MTEVETRDQVESEVKSHFTKKQPEPEPEELIDPAKKKKLLENMRQPTDEEVLSDYNLSNTKSHEEHVQRPRKSGKKVPQLEEQEKKSCPPLNVFSVEVDLEPEVARQIQDVAASLGVIMAEYLGFVVEYPI